MARNHADRNPLRDGRPHQFEARVAEQRRSGIADQHHRLPAARRARISGSRWVSLWVCRDSSGFAIPRCCSSPGCGACPRQRSGPRSAGPRARDRSGPQVSDGSGDDIEPSLLIAHYNPLYLPSTVQQPMLDFRRSLRLRPACLVALLGLQLAGCATVETDEDQTPPGVLVPRPPVRRRRPAGAARAASGHIAGAQVPAGSLIALLLPLTGRQSAAAIAVRDGFLTAYYSQPAEGRPGCVSTTRRR